MSDVTCVSTRARARVDGEKKKERRALCRVFTIFSIVRCITLFGFELKRELVGARATLSGFINNEREGLESLTAEGDLIWRLIITL